MNATAGKKIHIIGICGVATSALAIAFHRRGWKVTGSDKGFYPPVSTHLTEAGVAYHAGWHPELLDAMKARGESPDIVVAGGAGTSLSNPEVMWAKEHNIPLLSFAEALGKYIVKSHSIVTVGTWGKTTTSALLSFILTDAGVKPSYFTGGLSLSHETGAITDSDWSVVEGDEYKSAIWDKKPKFAYYSPTHLLLTSVSWDHADLYPTEADYFNTFGELVKKIPLEGGLIVACIDNAGVRKTLEVGPQTRIVTYGTTAGADYRYHSVQHTKAGITFSIDYKGNTYEVTSPMLGRFNAENIAGCFAMSHELGLDAQAVIKGIARFKGIRRRLERRVDGDEHTAGVTVLDCHAPTAEKAASVLESIREVYNKNIIAIFEPNIGGRDRRSISMYDGVFKDANTLVIPRLTKLKVDGAVSTTEQPVEGKELCEYISAHNTNTTVIYVEDDDTLIQKVSELVGNGDVIAFLGSHGFRGMIEAVADHFTK